MIGAFADGARVLGEPSYREVAERAADFVLDALRDDSGRLLRTYRLGTARIPAYLEDYAYVVDGLLRLHRATGDARWLDEARSLADRMIADFADDRRGGFFFTADDHESLLARVKDPYDDAMPAPNAVAVRDLIALHHLTGEASYLDVAGRALDAFAPAVDRSPASAPTMLTALEEYLDARANVPAADDAEAKSTPPAFTPGRLRFADGEGPATSGPAAVSAEVAAPSEPVCPGGAVRGPSHPDDRLPLPPQRQPCRVGQPRADDPHGPARLRFRRRVDRRRIPRRGRQGPRRAGRSDPRLRGERHPRCPPPAGWGHAGRPPRDPPPGPLSALRRSRLFRPGGDRPDGPRDHRWRSMTAGRGGGPSGTGRRAGGVWEHGHPAALLQ